jgi:uncharacterized membrane protein
VVEVDMHVRSDRGQLAPVYAVVILVAAGAMLLLAHIGLLAVRRAEARTAADAAALAGAAEGRDAADAVAQANGAVLESYVALGNTVEVRVRVGSTHATARAEREEGCGLAGQAHPVHFQPCPPTSTG